MQDLLGKKLDDFVILEWIGGGGMADVYKARQSSLDRIVALKVLHEQFARDEEFARRFRHEAHYTSRMDHPNIVHVYATGECLGRLYLVMQYIGGGSLKTLFKQGHLPLERGLELLEQIAQALEYAHRQGVVHRDVKPSNILLTPDGRPILSDFGIAWMAEGTQVTKDGRTVGTPEYMSPEQAQDHEVDGRSDIYSLGIILYELATGRPPFGGDTSLVVLHKQVFDPPQPPRDLNPYISRQLETVILQSLAKDPSQRFANAREMAEALHRLQGESGQAPRGSVADDPTVGFATPVTRASTAAESPTELDSPVIPAPPPAAVPVPAPLPPARESLPPQYTEALALLDCERWKEGIRLLEQLLVAGHDNTQVRERLNFARGVQQRLKDKEEQIRNLQTLYNKGNAAFQKKRWGDALAALDQVRRQDPSFRDVNKLVALAEQGQLATWRSNNVVLPQPVPAGEPRHPLAVPTQTLAAIAQRFVPPQQQPALEERLAQYHAAVLVGPHGSGKTTSALMAGRRLLEQDSSLVDILLLPPFLSAETLEGVENHVLVIPNAWGNSYLEDRGILGDVDRLEILRQRNHVILTSIPLRYEEALLGTRLGSWEPATQGLVRLEAGQSYDAAALQQVWRHLLDQSGVALTPGQLPLLQDPAFARALVGALLLPGELARFLGEVAGMLGEHPEAIARRLPGCVALVQDPVAGLARWMDGLSESETIFLLVASVLEGVPDQTVWAVYHELALSLRSFFQQLPILPLGKMRQRLAARMTASGPLALAYPFYRDLVLQRLVQQWGEVCRHCIPLLENLISQPSQGLVQGAPLPLLARSVARAIGQWAAVWPADVEGTIQRWAHLPEGHGAPAALCALQPMAADPETRDRALDIAASWSRDQFPAVRHTGAIAWGLLGRLRPDRALADLQLLASDERVEVRRAVARALTWLYDHHLGPAAELLARLADDQDVKIRQEIAMALERLSTTVPRTVLVLLHNWAGDGRPRVRWTAATALWSQGSRFNCADRLPIVRQLFAQEGGGQEVLVAYLSGPEAFAGQVEEVLRQLAHKEDAEVYANLRDILGRVAGERPDRVIQWLQAWSQEAEPQVRRYTLSLLREICPLTVPTSWPETGAAAPSPAAGSQPFGVLFAQQVRQILIWLTGDGYLRVRRDLADQVNGLASTNLNEVLYTLTLLSQDHNEALRQQVARNLADFASTHPQEIATIADQVVRDKSPLVKENLLGTLRQMATRAPAVALTLLAKLVQDRSITEKAVPAFVQVATQNPAPCMPVLVELAQEDDWALRQAILSTLDVVGPAQPQQAQAALVLLAQDRDTHTRGRVIATANVIATAAPESTLEICAPLLHDGEDLVRRQAAAAFAGAAQAHSQAQTALGLLRQTLAGEKPREVRELVLELTRPFADTQALGALPILQQLAQDSLLTLREQIPPLLVQTARTAPEESLNLLAIMVTDPQVRGKAQRAFEEVCAGQDRRLPAVLDRLADHADVQVRLAVAHGLRHYARSQAPWVLQVARRRANDVGVVKEALLPVLEEAGLYDLAGTLKLLQAMSRDPEVGPAASQSMYHVCRVGPGTPLDLDKLPQLLAGSKAWSFEDASHALSFSKLAVFLAYRGAQLFRRR